LDDTQSDIFSGSLSSVSDSLEDVRRDEFVPVGVDDVKALEEEEEIPTHEELFDSLSGLRSEFLNRTHLQNEEDTSIITAMVQNLNEGMAIVTLIRIA
jgi:hypothetical protein